MSITLSATLGCEPATTTIARLIAASGLARREAEVLAAHALAIGRASLIARAHEAIDERQAEIVRALFARRRAGEPVAYIVGHREFYGLDLTVTPDVLIPRPETELLVDLALARLAAPLGRQGGPRVLDLATGSGAVAIAIAKHAPQAEVWATDVSPAALAVARANAGRHGTAIRFVASDWFAALAGRTFDVVVANPPYVAAGDPHLEVGDVRFEPRAALVSGADGLDAIRRIVAGARVHLVPGGWFAVEHGHDQAARCRALFEAAGYRDVASHRDLAGIERVTAACAP